MEDRTPMGEPVEITTPELRDEFAELLHDGLPYVLGAVALLALAYAGAHTFLLKPAVPLWVAGGFLVAALLYLTLLFIVLRRSIPTHWAYPVAGLIGVLITVNLLTIGWARQDPRVSTDFMLLLIANGLVLLDRRWLVPLSAFTLGAWGVLVWVSPPDPQWVQYGYWVGTATFISGVLHLIRHRTVARQLRANKRLEAQNEELARLRDEAQAAERAKSALLANTSHEIRTPLNAITGMTSLLEQEELSPRLRSYVDTIQASSNHLLLVINDILDLSKLEADSFDLEAIPFRLHECVQSAVDFLKPRADEKGLPIEVEIGDEVPDAILGDPTRIRQILANLLSNAVKFTETGRINVFVQSLGEREGIHDLEFRVEDTGVGIPPEGQAQLFELFTQLDASTTRRYGGTGLGLSIVKRLTEAMGGTVGFKSQPGEGSTFWIRIPAQATDAPAPVPWKLRPGDLRGRRVLVVDDNETNRMILRRQLQGWHLDPVVASSAQEALNTLEDGPLPDLILLDYQMPIMDGAQLAREIRERHDRDRVPLIMLSSGALNREMIEAQSVPLDGFLTKPPSPSILYDLIVRLLSDQEASPSAAGTTLPPARIVAHRASARESAEASAADQALATDHPLSILIVEDSAVNQAVLDQMLQHLGYEPVSVGNGQEAVDAVHAEPFDLVLMDVQMPIMDGVEATRRLRSDPPTHGVPWIVALTAHALAGDRERLLGEGMDDYLPKPVDLDTLAGLLRRVPKVKQADTDTGDDDASADA